MRLVDRVGQQALLEDRRLERSAPACWNAATRRSVPDPVTPPKTMAEIGAEISAETIPQIRPATAT